MKFTAMTAAGLGLGLALAACDSSGPAEEAAAPAATEDVAAAEEPAGPQIVEVLAERDDLGTLRDLLTQANLGPALEGARDVTLLAPTDAAFAAVEPSTMEFLTDPANAATLRNVLGYHLLRTNMGAEALAAAIDGGAEAEALMTTSNNYELTARRNEEGEIVIIDGQGNEAKLVATDLTAVNGTVHVIDAVLMPPTG